MSYIYTFSNDALTMFLKGKPYNITDTHPAYDQVMQAIKGEIAPMTDDELLDLIDVRTGLRAKINHGRVSVGEDCILIDGKPTHNYLTMRMIKFLNQGLDISPWVKFLDRLLQNPSKAVLDDLFLWMERANMPLTPDGKFLAYKKVRDDYYSFYDGKTFHAIGVPMSMPRNEVDDNRENTCSYGLHFCGWEYLPSYRGNQGRVLILEIDPAEVVSIPTDYNHQKGRAFAYTPIGEVEAPHAWQGETHPLADVQVWDEDEDEDEITILKGDFPLHDLPDGTLVRCIDTHYPPGSVDADYWFKAYGSGAVLEVRNGQVCHPSDPKAGWRGDQGRWVIV